MTTKLLKQAMERLSQLPPAAQDSAARVLISQLQEEPEHGDREAIEQGREAFGRGDFVTLQEWRQEMGLRDRCPKHTFFMTTKTLKLAMDKAAELPGPAQEENSARNAGARKHDWADTRRPQSRNSPARCWARPARSYRRRTRPCAPRSCGRKLMLSGRRRRSKT